MPITNAKIHFTELDDHNSDRVDRLPANQARTEKMRIASADFGIDMIDATR